MHQLYLRTLFQGKICEVNGMGISVDIVGLETNFWPGILREKLICSP